MGREWPGAAAVKVEDVAFAGEVVVADTDSCGEEVGSGWKEGWI